MSGDDVIAALDVPAAARVDRRVPKALLVEHGELMTQDKDLKVLGGIAGRRRQPQRRVRA